MSNKINLFSIILFSLLISFSYQKCEENKNNCTQCNPLTDLCAICDRNILKPDENGGCEPSHHCIIGDNYCIKCDDKNEICSECEIGYFSDENGGCSYTNNCLISENGICLECKNDFYLIEELNFCKYKYSDDLKYCAEIYNDTGKCFLCEEGYYMTSVNKKCTNTDLCKKSTFGICTECNTGLYLDKTDNLCKVGNYEFNFCKISLDNKICNECIDGFYLSEDNICTLSRNCKKGNKNNDCIECSEGYFLSKSNICTTEEHCQIVNYQFGYCESCEDKFYLDIKTKKCFSNIEDEKYKYCTQVSSGNCKNCEPNYELGKDKKCVPSLNCLESENNICIKCEEKYYLGLDNRCVNVENCIYSNTAGECTECNNGYYFNPTENKCYPAINQFRNCKRSNLYYQYCDICKNDFYLSIPDKMCYNNNEDNIFYKCAVSNDGNKCSECVQNYYLGSKDSKCSKIKGCVISENENKCIECDEDYCLDVKKNICVDNYWGPSNDEEKIYFNCNKTNEEGTECEICNDYSELVNGICVNKVECAEEEDGECIKCNEKNYDYYDMCLNSVYGCVQTVVSNCLKCNNIFNFDNCTECLEGYELDDKGDCVDKAEF